MTVYIKDFPVIVFLGDGEIGRVVRTEINHRDEMTFWYYPVGHPRFLGKPVGKPKEVRLIPKELVVYRPPNQWNNVPTGGVFLISTASCGRNYLRDNIFGEYQQKILDLKKEIDIMNSGLMDLQEKLKITKDSDLLWDEIGKITTQIQDARKKLFQLGFEGFGSSYFGPETIPPA